MSGQLYTASTFGSEKILIPGALTASLWRYLGMKQVRIDLGNFNLDETHRSSESTKLAVENEGRECSYNNLM